MKDRREHKTGDANQGKPTIERVKRSEQLAHASLHRIHRTHATENHRSVEERIDPRQVFEIVVAAYADRKRAEDYGAANRAPSEQPAKKEFARQQCVTMMFKLDHAGGQVPPIASICQRTLLGYFHSRILKAL